MIYTVTLNPALDYVLHISNLKAGEVHHSTDEEIFWGGKGINVSTVLNELGTDSVALGFIAGFTGEALENGLKQMGIKTDFIRLNKGLTRINVKIKAQEETDIDNYGPEIDNTSLELLYEQLQQLTENDVLILAGSVPKSLPRNIYEEIMKRVSNKKIPVIVDATGDTLLTALKYKPFLIKPNNFELSDVIGRELKTSEELADGARKLKELGAVNVLVSMAGEGALLIDGQGREHRISAPKGKVLNSVGAGDSMVAGFVAGYFSTGDYSYALKLGTACGSATAFSLGLADRFKIEKILNSI